MAAHQPSQVTAASLPRWVRWRWTLGFAFGLVSSSPSQAQSLASVEVTAVGLRNDDGRVLALLFDREAGFPGRAEQAIKQARAEIRNGRAVFRFTELVPGTYAISVIHDENNNGRLDTNFIGIPKEGVGASNNPKPRFGPPDFDDAKFPVGDARLRQRIELTYL